MIEQGYRAGLFAEIVAIQSKYYARDWGFKLDFERARMQDLVDFSNRFNESQDLILRIEGENRLLGSLVIDGSDPKLEPAQAHFRWFMLDDSIKGQGFGTKMMQQAMDFVNKNYSSCYLDTFQGLTAARKLYEAHGFKEVKNVKLDSTWDANITKQKFEWLKNY